MKPISLLLALIISATTAFSTNYPGNGKTGFGGPVGTGSLDITYDGAFLSFVFNKGVNNMNDALVVYIDVHTPGGFSTTTNFMDASSGLRKAISGYDGPSKRAAFHFIGDFSFTPEYAFAFQPGSNGSATLVVLGESEHTEIFAPVVSNINTVSASQYATLIPPSILGLTTNVSFKFMATYISNTGYRAEEAIGDPMTGFVQGWNSYTSTTPALQFSATLPAVFGQFTATHKGKHAELRWETKTEINTQQFDILKSNNGVSWSQAGTVPAKNSTNGAVYQFTDYNIADAVTYYQVKLTDMDGSNSYSAVIILKKDGLTGLTLLGNPARGSINLNISNTAAANYRFTLYAMDGRKVIAQEYKHAGGSGRVSISLTGVPKGNYVLQVAGDAGNASIRVMVD